MDCHFSYSVSAPPRHYKNDNPSRFIIKVISSSRQLQPILLFMTDGNLSSTVSYANVKTDFKDKFTFQNWLNVFYVLRQQFTRTVLKSQQLNKSSNTTLIYITLLELVVLEHDSISVNGDNAELHSPIVQFESFILLGSGHVIANNFGFFQGRQYYQTEKDGYPL